MALFSLARIGGGMRYRRYVCGVSPVRGPPGPFAPVPNTRAAELASLKQSSPSHNDSALGRSRAQGRSCSMPPVSPFAFVSFCHPRRLSPTFVIGDLNRGSRVFAFPSVREENDTGFPLNTCGNDRRRMIARLQLLGSALSGRLDQAKHRRRSALLGTSATLFVPCRASGERGEAGLFLHG